MSAGELDQLTVVLREERVAATARAGLRREEGGSAAQQITEVLSWTLGIVGFALGVWDWSLAGGHLSVPGWLSLVTGVASFVGAAFTTEHGNRRWERRAALLRHELRLVEQTRLALAVVLEARAASIRKED